VTPFPYPTPHQWRFEKIFPGDQVIGAEPKDILPPKTAGLLPGPVSGPAWNPSGQFSTKYYQGLLGNDIFKNLSLVMTLPGAFARQHTFSN
jgi:hypothetical protein